MRSITGLLALSIVSFTFPSAASAKTPGSEYCFHGTCHRVKTLEETRRLIGVTTTLKASFYDDPKNDRYNPSNITSSGEYFRSDRPDNAASPVYPDGTKLMVWHPASRKALMIRVNNAGPYWGDRKLDLSRAAAETFGFRNAGVATVQVRVVEAPSKAEATYKKGRTYPSVKGYMGQFASLDAALQSTEVPKLVAVSPAKPSATLGLLDASVLKSLEQTPQPATPVVAAAQVANLPRRARSTQTPAVAFR